ncbi:MAG TPA: protein kinase [Vicinamibacterales bacterium]|nr:protein kinase [Vicinamibacterales bacterium]
MTGAGIVLGTAAYMAPEQARGKAVDKRADIWAFGCVLFEMLTGRRLFGGETVTETLAAVLRDTPQLDALPPNTPPHIRRLLARCLERDPRQRLRDVGEARIALAGGPTQPDSSSPGATPPRDFAPGSGRFAIGRVLPWTIAAIAVIGAVAAWITRRPADPPPLRKLELSLGGSSVAGPALSPDGKRIAFLADGHLRVKDLDQLGSRDIGAVPPIDRDFVFCRPRSRTTDAILSIWSRNEAPCVFVTRRSTPAERPGPSSGCSSRTPNRTWCLPPVFLLTGASLHIPSVNHRESSTCL